jgi:hypothetical protein
VFVVIMPLFLLAAVVPAVNVIVFLPIFGGGLFGWYVMSWRREPSNRDASRFPSAGRWLPQWRWLYGGGVWFLLLAAIPSSFGIDTWLEKAVHRYGELSTSEEALCGAALTASFLLGVVVQLLWPSTAMRRLVIPALLNAVIIVCFLVPGIYIWLEHPIASLASLLLFSAWISGAVVAERFGRQDVAVALDEVSDSDATASVRRKT